MSEQRVARVDTGIITNRPSTSVGWSTGRNVRFRPGAVYKTPGKELLATVTGNLPIRAMFTFRGHDGTFRTIVCCDTKVYSYRNNFTLSTDITPAPAPTGGANDAWQFGLIGGMPILSNGKNAVWKWADFGSTLTSLANAPTVCRALAVANNRVLVGNIQEGAGDYPARVRWPGIGEPEYWTKDLTGKSGGHDLINPSSTGIDAIERIQAFGHDGARVVIYAERNTWFATPADFPMTYRFDIGLPDVGLIAPRAHLFAKGVSAFMGADDFHMTTGTTFGFDIYNSVFPNLNKSAIKSAFSFYKPTTKEMFFCFPTADSTTPNTAAIYQLETKAWSLCDCDYLCHAVAYDETGYTWDEAPFGSWDAAGDSAWDDMSKAGIVPYEAVGDAQGRIFKFDAGDNNNGAAITGYIETGDLDMGSSTFNKALKEVWPSLKPQSRQTPLLIQVGVRSNLGQPVEWSRPTPFIIGIDHKVDFRKTGKYVRFRFYTDQKDTPWILDGYGYKFSLAGTR